MPLVPISQAASFFSDSSRRAILDALEHHNCLVFVGKVRRVDSVKFHRAFPQFTVPVEWTHDAPPTEWVMLQDLYSLLPLKVDAWQVSAAGDLRSMLLYGQWTVKRVGLAQKLYDLQQFKSCAARTEEELMFQRRAWHLAQKPGSLAFEISKLCQSWHDILREKRIGIRRAVRQLGQPEFEADYAAIKKKIETAPWGDKKVVALLKGMPA